MFYYRKDVQVVLYTVMKTKTSPAGYLGGEVLLGGKSFSESPEAVLHQVVQVT